MDSAKLKHLNIIAKILVISLIGLGCNLSNLRLNDVPGIYVCNHKYAPDTLYVLHDSSYLHIVHLNSRRTSDNGNWKINNGKIYFQSFRFYIPEYGPSNIVGTWVSKIEFGNNKEIRFIMSSEQNEYYKRITSVPKNLKISIDSTKMEKFLIE